MTIYAVTRKSDGVEVYRYEYTEPIDMQGFEFATHDHVVVPPPEPVVPPVVPVKITKLAFRQRFTPQERITIELASLDNPAASDQQRQLAAALRSSEQDVSVAQYIDLNRADTRDGVTDLEAYGLIAAGRATVILDTPPTSEEVWNG
jgi:hypothetical protein